jgi:uncharacterized protein YyaL (SSP411 family)
MPNRLVGETSPYLLQHANNPVDWMPWGPDALARAKVLDRPIFLSIGYAACHWCHVMERESFEDEPTAAFLNDRFVSIKVDREERPDLDSIYMGAVQAMTGSGGWPMSVFLTPDGQPFYGGTYFPNEPRHGMPSFRQVLEGVSEAWRTQRNEVAAAGQRLTAALAGSARAAVPGGEAVIDAGFFRVVNDALDARFDTRNGSWNGAPKFPQPMTLEYQLRGMAAGVKAPGAMVRFTLDKMADGGIRDQLGGGFHRYATDARWLVPHFEQMLYDNAQLARVYLHASQAFSGAVSVRYREVAVGVLDYMLRELRRDDGAFASSQDADTDGEEGATFTWSAAEIREVLGEGEAFDRFAQAYGVTDAGNWEGTNILSRVWSTPQDPPPRDDVRLESALADSRAKLLEARSRRAQPARDDKALAAWNGLAIAAFAEAGRLLGDERYTAAAVGAAEAIVGGLLSSAAPETSSADRPFRIKGSSEQGQPTPAAGQAGARRVMLGRSWKDGRAVGAGVLEDYADLAEGLLALYETTFDERWFTVARQLADAILDKFADPAGGFFDTAVDHERLITRPKDPQDNATPSGAAMATTVLLRLAAFTGEGRYRDAAERAIGTVAPLMAQYPTAFAQWLVAASFAATDSVEVAVIGDPEDTATRELLEPVWSTWRPFQVLAVASPSDAPDSAIDLLHDRPPVDGRPAAYVCRDFVCLVPVTTASRLIDQVRTPPAP